MNDLNKLFLTFWRAHQSFLFFIFFACRCSPASIIKVLLLNAWMILTTFTVELYHHSRISHVSVIHSITHTTFVNPYEYDQWSESPINRNRGIWLSQQKATHSTETKSPRVILNMMKDNKIKAVRIEKMGNKAENKFLLCHLFNKNFTCISRILLQQKNTSVKVKWESCTHE